MERDVPSSLRTWFVVHFVADMLAAVPLMVAPRYFMELVGWQSVDPVTTRLVAAALFGIGIESLLGRNADRATFRAMLNLKIIWSGTAILGIAWSIAEGAPRAAWAFLGIFVGFHILWWVYRLRLRGTHDVA